MIQFLEVFKLGEVIEKKDITTRADIESFLTAFYKKVILDETIAIIFTEIFPLNLQQHIPIITDFWETILLDNPVYKKNAMEVHYEINNVFKLDKKHFDAWLNLFNTTIDELYEGDKVILAKKRATDIAALMLQKMNSINL